MSEKPHPPNELSADEKRALLAELIRRKRGKSRELPASFGQLRLWFLEQLESTGATYNEAILFRLAGPLDRSALQRSLDALVVRHEILRTTFRYSEEDHEPVQVIRRPAPVDLQFRDLSEHPEATRERRGVLLSEEFIRLPFDLVRGPLIRAQLVRLSDEEHILVIGVHHILIDGWSKAILQNELAAMYDAFSSGKEPQLPGLPWQYGDYAGWQRKTLRGEGLEKKLFYWRDALAGRQTLQLPTDHPRASVPSSAGSRETLELPIEIATSLERLGHEHGATLFVVLLAAFNVLLHRYCGQNDISVGTLQASRNRRELEPLVGFFVNTVVLRNRVADNLSFRRLLKSVRKTTLEAFAHADVPFDRLVSELETDRDLGNSPLFQVSLVSMDASVDRPRKAGALAFRGMELSVDVDLGVTRFDLEAWIIKRPDHLQVTLNYRTELFEPSTVRTMLSHYATLLRAVATDSDRAVHDLPLLSPDERRTILTDWNHLDHRPPAPRSLHSLFEEQACVRPDTTAVVHTHDRLSYDEVNRRANRVAHHLMAYGVGPEVLVGICLPRCPDMIVAILGVLKAGGAYVPLDPDYPEERRSFILSDTDAAVVLTNRQLAAGLNGYTGHRVELDADGSLRDIDAESDLNPKLDSPADTLAYVIYTSGSTGRPKGVAITHNSAVGLVDWAAAKYDTEQLRGVLAATSICFDLSVFEIFAALSCGGTIVLCENALELPNLPARDEVTLVNTVPSAISELARQEAIPESVATVNLAGEPLQPALADQVYATGVDRVFDLYGPSEDTTYTTCALRERNGRATVGTPLPGKAVYILDRHLEPVPVRALGELYIAGAGLARGYLNRPDMTAECFLPDPWSNREGARMYRTGDLARFLPDGNIEFLGRIDHQVKLRGFRIELGEIEAVLCEHPDVTGAVAMVREDRPGVRRLVGYVVPVGRDIPAAAELRSFAKRKLPEYMVPAVLIVLLALPLTPNGKIDRKALPAPEESESGKKKTHTGPRNAVEELLCSIWAETLRLERVGIHDNFFELGGDSILSIQIVTRANENGLRLTPQLVFQYQTVADLAAVLGTGLDDAKTAARQERENAEGPLVPFQLWFLEQERAEPHRFNQALVLSLRQRLDPEVCRKAVARVMDHHDALRLRFLWTDSGWRQVFTEPIGDAPFGFVDLSQLPEKRQRAAVEAKVKEVRGGLNLEEGPVLRVVQFVLGPGSNSLLLIVIHRLAADGPSWRILLEDLRSACEQLSHGEPVRLPRKTTSFGHWARCLGEYTESPACHESLDYWLGLPWDEVPGVLVNEDPVPSVANSVSNRSMSLTTEETLRLLEDVPQAYNTRTQDVLLTALVETFAHWTGSEALLLHVEEQAREDLGFESGDLSRTVGCFTSRFPLILTAGSAAESPLGIGASLKSIKEQLRAVPDRGLSFGALRSFSKDESVLERLEALPRPRIAFKYLGQLGPAVDEGFLFGPSGESLGCATPAIDIGPHHLEITVVVVGGRLEVTWAFDAATLQQQTIDDLANCYLANLRELISHCTSTTTSEYTPSDFPLASLDQEQLDGLLVKHGAGDIEDVYELSPIQELMLVHHLNRVDSDESVDQRHMTVDRLEDRESFRRAWEEVFRRHAVLRSTFASQGLQRSLQIVHRNVDLHWDEQDWRDASPAERTRRLEEFLAEDRRRGFDPSRAPLVRFALIRMESDSYQFVRSMHRALIDGWSTGLINTEALRLYEAFRRSEDAVLPPARPYRDYVAWLKGQDPAQAKRYWQRVLGDLTEPTHIASDPRVAESETTTERFGSLRLVVEQDTTSGLASVAGNHRITQGAVLQSAWAVVLSKLSDRRDVVFGTAVSGRPAEIAGVDTIAGLFLNNLPLRVDVAGDQPLIELLRVLHDQTVELERYAHTPIPLVQEWSGLPPGVGMFDTLVAYQNLPALRDLREGVGSGVRFRGYNRLLRTEYPLTLTAVPGSQLCIDVVFDRRRFEEHDVSRILQGIRTVLECASADPEQPVRVVQGRLAGLMPPASRVATGFTHAPGTSLEAAATDYAAPQTKTESLLADIWQDLLGRPRVGLCDNLFDLGGTSVLAVQLISRFEADTGVRLNPVDLLTHNLGQLAAAAENRMAAKQAHAGRKAPRRTGSFLKKLSSLMRKQS